MQVLDGLRGLVGLREEVTRARCYIDNLSCEIQSERMKKSGLEILHPRMDWEEGRRKRRGGGDEGNFTVKSCSRRSNYLTWCESTVCMGHLVRNCPLVTIQKELD